MDKTGLNGSNSTSIPRGLDLRSKAPRAVKNSLWVDKTNNLFGLGCNNFQIFYPAREKLRAKVSGMNSRRVGSPAPSKEGRKVEVDKWLESTGTGGRTRPLQVTTVVVVVDALLPPSHIGDSFSQDVLKESYKTKGNVALESMPSSK